jgi:hypothetical protein
MRNPIIAATISLSVISAHQALGQNQVRDADQPRAAIMATGQKLFGKLNCADCHSLNGIAGNAPSLHDVGDRLSRSEIRRQILTPYRGRTVAVVFKDGRMTSFDLVEQTDSTLLVRPSGTVAPVRTLKKADLESFQVNGSRMPEGLVDGLPPKDLDALIEFLAAQRANR